MTAAEPREDGTAPPSEPVVIRDKRRLDPESGLVRPDAAVPEEGAAPEPDAEAVRAELTADLQRLSAEYANYRKRVERDRVLVLEMATAGFLEALLPLLDSVELARQHGDLDGAFKGVGEGLEQLADRHGLERYAAEGDAFDPAIHNALMQAPEDPAASVATVAQVLQPGWRLRSGRVLRPAGVAVAEPGAAEPAEGAEPSVVPGEEQ
ncbi:MAG: GrpE protein [Frankiales bacterium]|nr:GrpE protein [Frankiales bacterium]